MTLFTERARAGVRTAALDAVAEAIAAGHTNISMARVATAVGVSRQTLYNEFGNRESLLTALAERENAVLVSSVLRTLDGDRADDVATAVATAVRTALEMAADNVLHKALLSGDSSLVGVFVTHGEPILTASRAQVSAAVQARFPAPDGTDARLLVDVVIRFVHSHLMLPEQAAETVARQIHRLVEGYLAGSLAAAPTRSPAQAPHRPTRSGGSR